MLAGSKDDADIDVKDLVNHYAGADGNGLAADTTHVDTRPSHDLESKSESHDQTIGPESSNDANA